MRAGIVSVGSYIPPRRVSNDELTKIIDTSDDGYVPIPEFAAGILPPMRRLAHTWQLRRLKWRWEMPT